MDRAHDDRVSFSSFASLALHAGLLLASAVSVPPLGETPEDAVPSFDTAFFTTSVIAASEPDEDVSAVTAAESTPDGLERVDSRCDLERGGSMGKPEAADAHLRYAVQGMPANPDPHVARVPADRGWGYSFDGWPRPSEWGGDPDAPVAVFGRDDSLGNDPRSARGNTWGDDPGAAFGSPGAGVGRRALCEQCGGVGLGVARRDSGTSEGGATGTESAASRVPW